MRGTCGWTNILCECEKGQSLYIGTLQQAGFNEFRDDIVFNCYRRLDRFDNPSPQRRGHLLHGVTTPLPKEGDTYYMVWQPLSPKKGTPITWCDNPSPQRRGHLLHGVTTPLPKEGDTGLLHGVCSDSVCRHSVSVYMASWILDQNGKSCTTSTDFVNAVKLSLLSPTETDQEDIRPRSPPCPVCPEPSLPSVPRPPPCPVCLSIVFVRNST